MDSRESNSWVSAAWKETKSPSFYVPLAYAVLMLFVLVAVRSRWKAEGSDYVRVASGWKVKGVNHLPGDLPHDAKALAAAFDSILSGKGLAPGPKGDLMSGLGMKGRQG